MPRLDGTGPMGQGPRTGWGRGSCAGGMGMRRRFISPKNELAALEDEEKMLEDELKAVKEEMEALKKAK